MEADPEWTKDGVFVSYFPLPTLQAMASYSVARLMVYNVIGRLPKILACNCINYNFDELITGMKLPRSIEEIIKRSVRQVCDELQKCDENFAEYLRFDTISNLRYCVWFPTGRINLQKTATKILSIDKLSQLQKFSILSEFCMKDQIETFCVDSLPETFSDGLSFINVPIFFYWLCNRKNQLDQVQLEKYDSVDLEMASFCYGDERWTAFKYFWNRLNADDQTRLTIDLLNGRYYVNEYSLQVFSMMSRSQQHLVISQVPKKIMLNSFFYLESSRCILQVWIDLQDAVTAENFAEMLLDVLSRVIPAQDEERIDILMEIWKAASDHHKNYVIETRKREILKLFFPYDKWTGRSRAWTHCSTAFRFLRLILSQEDANFCKEFIFKNVSMFGEHGRNPWPYDDIITFCLPSLDDQLTFKTMVANNDKMEFLCRTYLKISILDVLTAKLRFYLPDQNDLQEYLKRLLLTEIKNPWIIFHFVKQDTWESGWHNFAAFFDELCSDPSQALQLKKSFVSSFATRLATRFHSDDQLNGALKMVEFVLVGDELTAFKRQFAYALADCFRFQFLDVISDKIGDRAKYVIGNVLWCFDEDENAVKQFQNQILTVDMVFEAIFEFNAECCRQRIAGDVRPMLDLLDQYLNWYMPNDQDRKEYKMKRINKPDDFDLIRLLIECGESEDYLQVTRILRWCCDDDQQAVDELKSRHPEFELCYSNK